MVNSHSHSFENQVVLVTGSGQGIGLAIAKSFFSGGARVALNDLSSEQINRGLRKISDESTRLKGFVADVSVSSQVTEMVNRIVRKWKQIDIVINNAGIYPSQKTISMSEDEWDRVMGVNAKGTFLVSREAARHMIRLGIPGHIVNIASGSYHRARVGSAHYCASKAAVVMFSKALAIELASSNIAVNVVAPGLIDTGTLDLDKEYINATRRQIPAGRLGNPDDVAEAVLGLTSMRSRYITGAVLSVDGGLALGRYGIPVS